ncbi:hypothetical protein PQE68_gp091 [Bacillus phage vB_BanS_Sophrita]|uniref:Uncharacterized protein n=1 Tax=Bacillus phage vB_BanS_Sophrita TaxID=2894790 RepID=A0AAE8YXM1_9CAUD|nr:hypothetical protein PQE68_gp091 [Bacillus phage vB_BanS_Sophrita]UGO50682.1 hypothetical protein SOPHRITA_91 [Bacillus phage vB_BanS_Sophrita]
MIGLAKDLKVKTFADYTDGDVEEKMNQFFLDNAFVEIIDIKYFNGYSTIESDMGNSYGRETGMIIYRKTKASRMKEELLNDTLRKHGYLVDNSKK